MTEFIVKTKGLNFSYQKKGKDINQLNLEVPKGSIYGFLGPNGSGKTTTIRLLLGLLRKQSGEVEIFNKPFKGNRIDSLNRVGALIENPSLYEHLNAVQNLRIAANYRGDIAKERINEVLEIVKLSHVKRKKVKAFSLGMKQRLGLAVSLLSNPDLLILDEPTNGLDPKGIIEMRMLIKELNEKYGTTIFISSHLLSEIEKTCTHVGIIRKGKMLFQNTVTVLKEGQSDQLSVLLESADLDLTLKTLQKMDYNANVDTYEDHFISVQLKEKSEIPLLIDSLRKNNVEIYQISIKNNLEDLFLNLTENA